MTKLLATFLPVWAALTVALAAYLQARVDIPDGEMLEYRAGSAVITLLPALFLASVIRKVA